VRKSLPIRREAPDNIPAFYNVTQIAKALGTSPMTLYRAINEDKFPAIRIRGRLVIPGLVLDQMIQAALSSGALVDAADWVRRDDDPDTSHPPHAMCRCGR
jgi:excisionase family DNA binding protein